MALSYLLDTNVLSEPVRKVPNAHVVAQMHTAMGQMALAATSWHELLFGVFRMPTSHKRTIIEHYLLETVGAEIPILPYGAESATWFAKERVRLSKLGRPPSYPDGQIASIAATNNLILVTRNVADFTNFEGLQVENWFDDE